MKAMTNLSVLCVGSLSLLLVTFANAATYLTPEDGKAIVAGMAPPPSADSDQQKRDLDAVLRAQSKRSPVDIARCRAEVNGTAFVFHDVLGDWFNATDLPVTAELFKHVYEDTKLVSDVAKDLNNNHRQRPPLVDPEVHPCVRLEHSNSYPSGHATRGIVWALVLAEIFPEERDLLLARGTLFGQDRVTAGVHYPSDVAAGQELGRKIAARLLADPKFQADLAKAKQECLAHAAAVSDS